MNCTRTWSLQLRIPSASTSISSSVWVWYRSSKVPPSLRFLNPLDYPWRSPGVSKTAFTLVPPSSSRCWGGWNLLLGSRLWVWCFLQLHFVTRLPVFRSPEGSIRHEVYAGLVSALYCLGLKDRWKSKPQHLPRNSQPLHSQGQLCAINPFFFFFFLPRGQFPNSLLPCWAVYSHWKRNSIQPSLSDSDQSQFSDCTVASSSSCFFPKAVQRFL